MNQTVIGLSVLAALGWLLSRAKRNPSGVYTRRINITNPERRCLALFRAGYSDAETADVMGLSRWTVRDLKRSLFNKLGADSKAELAKFAMQRGIAA